MLQEGATRQRGLPSRRSAFSRSSVEGKVPRHHPDWLVRDSGCPNRSLRVDPSRSGVAFHVPPEPGGVQEWLNWPARKAGVPATVPWVRIPPPPLDQGVRKGRPTEIVNWGLIGWEVGAPFRTPRRCAPEIANPFGIRDSSCLFVKGGRAPLSHFPPGQAGSEQSSLPSVFSRTAVRVRWRKGQGTPTSWSAQPAEGGRECVRLIRSDGAQAGENA